MADLFIRGVREVRKIYRESFVLWGGGLSFRDYLGLYQDLKATRWGSRHLEFLTWENRWGTILSSLKRYRPLLACNGSVSRITLIGAVYTPVRHRGRGHAGALIRAVVERALQAGDPVVMLFSDIGTGWYRRIGFNPLPAAATAGRIDRGVLPREGPVDFRSLDDELLPRVMAAHEAGMEHYGLRFVRDAEHWEFLLARAEYYRRRASVPGAQRFRAAFRGGTFIGYLVDLQDRGEWEVREVGAADGSHRTMADILRGAAGPAFRRGARTVCGWLPRELVQAVPEWDWSVEDRVRGIPMATGPGLPEDSDSPEWRLNSFFPFMDQF